MDLSTLPSQGRKVIEKLQASGECLTWEGLSDFGPDRLVVYKGVGGHTLCEIRALLATHGLPWGVLRDSPLGFGPVSKRAEGLLGYAQCEHILDLAAMSRDEAFAFPNAGEVTIDELEALLVSRGLFWETPRALDGLEAVLKAAKDKLKEERRRLRLLEGLVSAERASRGVQ